MITVRLGLLLLMFIAVSAMTASAQAAPESPSVKLSQSEQEYLSQKAAITFCVDPDWMPFEAIRSGKLDGMTSDFQSLFTQRLGTPFRFVATDSWAQSQDWAKAGKCDVLPMVSITEERKAYLTFSAPYLSYSVGIFSANDLPFISGLDDLAEYLVGIGKGSSIWDYVEKEFPGNTFVPVDGIEDGLLKVSSGQIEAYLIAVPVATHNIKNLGLTNLKVAGHIEIKKQLRMGISRQSPQLSPIIQKLAHALTKSDIDGIYEKWVGLRVDTQFDYAFLWKVAIFLLIVMTAILLWLRKLSRLNKEILHSKKQAEQYLDIAGTIIVALDSEARVTMINREGCKLIGKAKEDIIDKSWIDSSIPKEQRPLVAETFRQIMHGDIAPVKQYENEIIGSKGDARLISWHNTMLIDDTGKIIGSLSSGTDITDQRHTDKAFHTLTNTMIGKVGEAFFDSVTHELCEWFTADAAAIGKIVDGNRVVIVSMELDGETVEHFEYPLEKTPCAQAITEGACFYPIGVQSLFPEDQDLVSLHAEGYIGAPIINRENEAIGVVWAVSRKPLSEKAQWRDVLNIVATKAATELERQDIIKGLVEARLSAEQADMAKTKFLATASHDLRQPLQALNLFLYALGCKEHQPENLEIISNIKASVASLDNLLNGLLDISRLEAGLVDPHRQTLSIFILMERLASEYSLIAKDEGVEVRLVETKAVVYTDPVLLESILRNLLSNAVKNVRHGKVLLGCRHHGDRIAIEVWDNGCGIPESKLSEIFQEFTQIDNEGRDRDKGLGLGLSIVEKLAGLLDHRITVRSWEGKGSAFTVELPLADEAVTLDQKELVTVPSPSSKMSAFIVEDEASIRTSLALALRHEGYEVHAISGDDFEECKKVALDMSYPPNIILADFRLQHGNTGIEVINCLRKTFEKDIPAILLTGDTAPNRLAEAKDSGLALLHKPIEMEKLLQEIEKVIQLEQDTPRHT